MVDDPIPTELRARALVRKTGEEEFKENGVAIAKLSEYWQWSASDLLGNTERGRLAEYIVATEGSHRQFKHPTKVGRVTVPGKPNDDLPIGTLNSVLRQAGLKKQAE